MVFTYFQLKHAVNVTATIIYLYTEFNMGTLCVDNHSRSLSLTCSGLAESNN